MRKIKILFVIALVEFLVNGSAIADESYNVYKATCIPELDYFEIAPVRVDLSSLEINQIKKQYNLDLIDLNEQADCRINRHNINISFTYDRARTAKTVLQECGATDRASITIKEDNKVIKTIPFSGRCQDQPPYIVTYNKFIISYCDDNKCIQEDLFNLRNKQNQGK